MEFTYENVMEYMDEYFRAYSTIAQDPRKNHEMNKYYSPDLTVHSYVTPLMKIGREDFLAFTAAHQDIIETLIPELIAVDEKKKVAGAVIRGELTSRDTGELVALTTFSAHYKFSFDENKDFKITDLYIFAEPFPEGHPTFVQLYGFDGMEPPPQKV